MKFVTETLTRCKPRLGVLKEIESQLGLQIETPCAMLYTKGGSIPHITNEVFKLVCKQPQILQIPLQSTYNFDSAMREFPESITEYVGMRGCVSCMTVQDPAQLTQSGFHIKDFVPIWTRNGKVLINSNKYMDCIEAFKPDMYYLLSDGDTNKASKNKRITKSVDNTVKYFTECMERHKKSGTVLKNSFVLAAVAGGYCKDSRERCIKSVSGNDLVGGYFIDGLHNNGPEVEFVPFKEVESITAYVIDQLPESKLRVVSGCWNPVTLLKLVELGVDLFDTSYCHILTDRSAALTFTLDITNENPESTYEINLHDTKFGDDFRPILPDCSCLSCRKYSRAYIHHLVTVQELLGPLLLMIHNVHHYMQFFEKIRECIRQNTFRELFRCVSMQFNKHQDGIVPKGGS